MNDHPLPQTTSYLLATICKAQRNWAEQELATVGLHVGQEMLLSLLWQEDGLTQSDLALRLGVQPATVCKMLGRMEAGGLIATHRDERDSRISRVYLSDEGHAFQQTVMSAWARLETRLLAGFTADEVIALRQVLTRLAENLTTRSEIARQQIESGACAGAFDLALDKEESGAG